MTKKVIAIGMISHLHRTTLNILKTENITSVEIRPEGKIAQYFERTGLPVRQPITLSMLVVENTMAMKHVNPFRVMETFLSNKAI